MIVGGKLKIKMTGKKRSGPPVNIDKLRQQIIEQKQKNASLEEKRKVEQDEEEQRRIREAKVQPVRKGKGRIIISHTTVHGTETEFQTELEAGDTLIIRHPDTGEREERKITMVLSNNSMGLENEFSSRISYEYQKKPVVEEREKEITELVQERLQNERKRDQKANSKTMVEIRGRSGMWGYKTSRQEVKGELSKEELLNMRSKKIKDKFCWF